MGGPRHHKMGESGPALISSHTLQEASHGRRGILGARGVFGIPPRFLAPPLQIRQSDYTHAPDVQITPSPPRG